MGKSSVLYLILAFMLVLPCMKVSAATATQAEVTTTQENVATGKQVSSSPYLNEIYNGVLHNRANTVDGSVYTMFNTPSNTQGNELVVDLGKTCYISQIEVYGRPYHIDYDYTLKNNLELQVSNDKEFGTYAVAKRIQFQGLDAQSNLYSLWSKGGALQAAVNGLYRYVRIKKIDSSPLCISEVYVYTPKSFYELSRGKQTYYCTLNQSHQNGAKAVNGTVTGDIFASSPKNSGKANQYAYLTVDLSQGYAIDFINYYASDTNTQKGTLIYGTNDSTYAQNELPITDLSACNTLTLIGQFSSTASYGVWNSTQITDKTPYRYIVFVRNTPGAYFSIAEVQVNTRIPRAYYGGDLTAQGFSVYLDYPLNSDTVAASGVTVQSSGTNVNVTLNYYQDEGRIDVSGNFVPGQVYTLTFGSAIKGENGMSVLADPITVN